MRVCPLATGEVTATGSSVDATTLTCALLDLDLGDGSGADVATALRDAKSTLPIAFFTSEKSGAELTRAKSLGPVFAKPDELAAALEWIRKHA